MRELLSHRDFRLLLTGQTLSMFGDTTMLLVFGMWAKELTGSNSIAGLTIFAMVLPSVFAPVGGILIDRTRRRRLMIATDLLMAVVMLGVFAVDGRDDLWILFAVAAAYGASSIVFGSARLALLSTMLPPDLLGQANAVLRTTREALRMVGPLTGAALFAAFGGSAVAALDSASFLCSAVALLAMRVREPRPERTEHHWLSESVAGFGHIRRQPILRGLTYSTMVVLSVVGLIETAFFVLVTDGLHKPVEFVGVLSAAQGLGAIIAGISAVGFIRRVPLLPLYSAGLGLFATGALALITEDLPIVVLAIVISGAGLPLIVIAIDTAIQRFTPNELQGRVGTAIEVSLSVPQTMSIAVGAALVAVVDYRLLLLVTGLGTLGCGLYALRLYRRHREPAAAEPPPEPVAASQPGAAS
ncbi:MAG TPA: MFS transporter [Actinomycetes bacterium]|nr:MFS transporter [Actinomycetes bacterium]